MFFFSCSIFRLHSLWMHVPVLFRGSMFRYSMFINVSAMFRQDDLLLVRGLTLQFLVPTVLGRMQNFGRLSCCS